MKKPKSKTSKKLGMKKLPSTTSKVSRSSRTSQSSPKLEKEFVNTKITKGNDGQYHIEGFILDQSIVKVKNQRPLTNYDDAVFIAEATKNAILTAFNQTKSGLSGLGKSELKKNPQLGQRSRNLRRRNPPIDQKNENDEFGSHSFQSGVKSGIGMPSNPYDAFELGRMTGVRDALENYCPIPFYNFKAKRNKDEMLGIINNIVNNAFHDMARSVVTQREGRSRFVPLMPRQQGPQPQGNKGKQPKLVNQFTLGQPIPVPTT